MLPTLRIPIRFKILIALLFVITAVVSVITFTMAHLFHADKKAYVSDMVSVIAIHTAEEAKIILAGYRERLRAYAHLFEDENISQEKKVRLLEEFFGEFGGFVSISVIEDGREVATLYDRPSLEDANLDRTALVTYREENPLPLEEIVLFKLFRKQIEGTNL